MTGHAPRASGMSQDWFSRIGLTCVVIALLVVRATIEGSGDGLILLFASGALAIEVGDMSLCAPSRWYHRAYKLAAVFLYVLALASVDLARVPVVTVIVTGTVLALAVVVILHPGRYPERRHSHGPESE